MNDQDILDKITRGTTTYRHRRNPSKIRVLHNAGKWAIIKRSGESYSCNGFKTYVPGSVDLVVIPQDLTCAGGISIWDTGKDAQGRVDAKKLARIVEVTKETLEKTSQSREAAFIIREILKQEFSKEKANA